MTSIGRKTLTYLTAESLIAQGTYRHWRITLKNKRDLPQGPGGILRSPAAVAELRDEFLPNFMLIAGLNDLTRRGFRMVVESADSVCAPEIHLISGQGVAAQNPQDWLSPSVPWNPQAPAVFFEKCAEAAASGQAKMAFGNQMLYAGENRDVFGVRDGDPKSDIHFLILAREAFGNFMDQGFTAEHLNQFFETAFRISHTLMFEFDPVRYTANLGTGFQVGPRVHMHVQHAREDLPSLFPQTYGFSVTKQGTVTAPADSPAHKEVVRLIAARQEIKGFSSEAAAQRRAIDQQLFVKLNRLA